MKEKQQIEQVQCNECGGQPRNHLVVAEYTVTSSNDYAGITVWYSFQIVKCMGCDAVRFRECKTCTESRNEETGELEEYDVAVFPDTKALQQRLVNTSCLSDDIGKMYQETLACLNAGANTLAAAGLRATVEAICKYQKIKAKNLEKRIDGLVQAGVLAKAQADFLHEERYLGNEAVHEMKTPSKQDLLDGLRIVEGLMNTLYVLPTHADRLKARRSSPGKTPPKATPKMSTK